VYVLSFGQDHSATTLVDEEAISHQVPAEMLHLTLKRIDQVVEEDEIIERLGHGGGSHKARGDRMRVS